MTSSNTPPRTEARVPRRAFLLQAACGLLTVILAAPSPSRAQGTVIQFSVGGSTTYNRYRVNDDGTSLQTLPFPNAGIYRLNASSRSAYWDGPQHVGRQYLYVQDDGTNTSSGFLRVWSEATGQSKAVSNFQSPYSVYIGAPLWSNDGLDSFISFTLYNRTTGESWIYRAHVSATDIASASFQPLTLGDPRLERVTAYTGPQFYWWNHDGSRFYYIDPRATMRTSNQDKIRVKIVGIGNTMDDDPIAFVAPAPLSELRVIPPVDPLNPVSDRYIVASTNASAPGNGILAIDLATSSSWWLATQSGWSSSGIRGPCFSPDGSTIAFGNSRTVSVTIGKKKTTAVYYGVYAVPFFGGSISPPLAEVTSSVSGWLTVNNWFVP